MRFEHKRGVIRAYNGAGAICVVRYATRGRVWAIEWIKVPQKAQGAGVATAAMRGIIAEIRRGGKFDIIETTTVAKKNTASRALWRRLSFTEIASGRQLKYVLQL